MQQLLCLRIWIDRYLPWRGGVIVAGVLQLAFQLPFLARLGLLPRPKIDWRDPSVKKVLMLMAPAMFGGVY